MPDKFEIREGDGTQIKNNVTFIWYNSYKFIHLYSSFKRSHMETSTNTETRIPLLSGAQIVCPSFESNPEGVDYISIQTPEGVEEVYWHSSEWGEDPVSVMGAIMGAVKQHSGVDTVEAAWNEAEELFTSLTELSGAELEECRESLRNRAFKIMRALAPFVGDSFGIGGD